MDKKILKIHKKETGKIFLTGDIHGEKSLLMEELFWVNFNFEKDILICTGDLVDRGPENVESIKLLNEPWFYSVFGNHDYHLIEFLETGFPSLYQTTRNGGYWAFDLTSEQVDEILPLLKNKLSFGIEIYGETDLPVCVFHSYVPGGDWNSFKKDRLINETVLEMKFSYPAPVLNCDLLIHGHSVTAVMKESEGEQRMVSNYNVRFIDVGLTFFKSHHIFELDWDDNGKAIVSPTKAYQKVDV